MITATEIEQLFKSYYEALHRYAFSILKDSDKANDVIQMVFLKLWEKRETINILSSPKAYLYQTVYHESLNYLKKEEVLHKHEVLSYTANHDEKESQPFAMDYDQEWKQKVEKVLQELPPQCKAVFIKSRAEQKKYAEIAAELNISVKTVEAHMSKALKIIRNIVGVFMVIACLYIELI